MILSEKCPAKINLFLKIINRQNSGFHDLQSLFAKINLFDEIIIEKSDKFELIVNSFIAQEISNQNNIIKKIFDYFFKNFSLDFSLKIILNKHIPIGAGLGGGSSDGANFIKIINQIYNLNLSKTQMQKISLEFGSDLPFFFEENICFVEGRGEKITQLDSSINQKFLNQLNSSKILLINPQIILSTPQIFQNFSKKIDNNLAKYSTATTLYYISSKSIFNLINNQGNDLENSAFEQSLNLKNLFDELKNFKSKSLRMSGSGSSIFMIFKNDNELRICQEFLNQKYPDFLVKKIEIICD
jgi:4-diphosphocytidyl-2-C-methyl-D-erythritol kinase